MPSAQHTRRQFLAASAATACMPRLAAAPPAAGQPVVSIVKIRNGNIDAAVERAIDLLGGMSALTRGKDRILLKPNLVSPVPSATTKPAVIRTLARLLLSAHKEVAIAEGSAAAPPFNVHGAEIFRTTKTDLLNALQQDVFDRSATPSSPSPCACLSSTSTPATWWRSTCPALSSLGNSPSTARSPIPTCCAPSP